MELGVGFTQKDKNIDKLLIQHQESWGSFRDWMNWIIIQSNLEQEPQTELVAQLSQEFYNSDTIQLLLKSLEKMDFEVGGFKLKLALHRPILDVFYWCNVCVT
jgi:hypothetical protein